MIEETGTVLSTTGDYALVGTDRKTTCGGCSAKNSCGTGTIGKFIGNKFSKVEVLNTIGAKAGEQVVVGVPDKVLTTVSFRFYVVPLVLLIIFALAGEALSGKLELLSTEPLSILGGLLGLTIGAIWLRSFSKKTSHDEAYQPVILRRVNSVNVSSDFR